MGHSIVKILQITRQFYPSVGGIESVTLGLSKALRQEGLQCDVATLQYVFQTKKRIPPFSMVEGVPVYRLRHIGGRRYPIVPGILSLSHDYDLLHIHAIDFFVDFLSLMQFEHQKPIVVSTHGGIFHTRWLWPLKHLWFQTLTRLSLKNVSYIVADSKHDMELFDSILPKNKLRYIPNGVDIQKLLIQERHPDLGLLVGIGRLFENKRVEWIIHAISQLKGKFPSLRLVWIGPGSAQQICHLNNLAAKSGITDSVKFTGAISITERDSYLAHAHLFVSAARYEAFGVSTIEAMAAGVVPVVTSVGIHPEVVQSGINGWLWSGDVHSLIETLRQALDTTNGKLTEMGDLARLQTVRFQWESVAADYIELYEESLR